MGGSIHIHGTDSSVVDTVFVCRTTGTVKRRLLATTAEEIATQLGEITASAKALQELAQTLQELTGRFRLGAEGPVPDGLRSLTPSAAPPRPEGNGRLARAGRSSLRGL